MAFEIALKTKKQALIRVRRTSEIYTRRYKSMNCTAKHWADRNADYVHLDFASVSPTVDSTRRLGAKYQD